MQVDRLLDLFDFLISEFGRKITTFPHSHSLPHWTEWDSLGQNGTGSDKSGHIGTRWDKLGQNGTELDSV